MSPGNKKLSLLLSLLLAVVLTVGLSACGSSSSSGSSSPSDPVVPGEVNLLGQPRDGYVGSEA